jgi:hypothetical protein
MKTIGEIEQIAVRIAALGLLLLALTALLAYGVYELITFITRLLESLKS